MSHAELVIIKTWRIEDIKIDSPAIQLPIKNGNLSCLSMEGLGWEVSVPVLCRRVNEERARS